MNTHKINGWQSPTYAAWLGLRQRCNNPKHRAYKYYGGRGIKVCGRWDGFENFLEDMGERPEGLSIDRKNNNGDYTPTNCRWATKQEQQNNTRSNKLLTYGGKTRTLAQWSRELGINYRALQSRLHKGWSLEKAFKPKRKISVQA